MIDVENFEDGVEVALLGLEEVKTEVAHRFKADSRLFVVLVALSYL